MTHQATTPLLVEAGDRRIEQLDLDSIFHQLDQHGAVLFRGFDADKDAFHAFAERFNSMFVMQPYEDRKSYGEQPGMQSVPVSKTALGPHYEWGSSPFRPDLIWFCCLQPARAGGETTLYHGEEVFRNLDSASQERLTEQAVIVRDFFPMWAFKRILESDIVRRMFGADPLRALQQVPGLSIKGVTNDERVVVESRIDPVARKPDGAPALRHNLIAGYNNKVDSHSAHSGHSDVLLWEDGEALDNDIVQAIRRATEQSRVDVAWQTGDILMIDNNWVMHGRNGWDGSPREIVTLGSLSTRHQWHRQRIEAVISEAVA